MREPLVGVFDINKNEKTNGDNKLATKANVPLVNQVIDRTIQARGTTGADAMPGGLFRDFAYLYYSNDIIPAWWSSRRDRALSEFWKSVNLLAGAMYTMTSKLTTIPFHIEPRDPAITSHFREAERFDRRLKESAEFGKGWIEFFTKQIQSLLGQDNGRFMEIISLSGRRDGPIVGPALSVAHLAPDRCTRTGDPKYPVIYRDTDGTLHKLHWTRVAFNSQLPSERVEMRAVGLCAVSRATSYAQNILDITTYKEEKLGSRPKRGIVIVGGGLDAESFGNALQVTDQMSTDRGHRRFSMLPIIGSPDIEEPTAQLMELSSLPDGFDEQKATDIAMAAIALAFGVDARELWPNAQRGATRADALLSHIKQRGKGPGQIIAQTEHMFNHWYLPPYLRMVFDYQDDAQDRQRAEIRRERSLTRKEDLANGVTDDRTERERMVKEGEISTAQFARLELSDGRLPNGKPLKTLFYIDDPIYNEVLAIPGLPDPLDILGNDAMKALEAISTQIPIAYGVIARETRQIQMVRAQEALAALQDLQSQYENVLGIMQEPDEANVTPSENRQGVREGAQSNDEDESPMNIIPNDESNLQSENSPRDFKKSVLGLFDRKSKSRDIRKALTELVTLLDKPEPPTVIQFTPEVNVDVPATVVNIPKQDAPKVIVNVPEQEPPVVNIEQKAPIVRVPKQDAPIVNVPEPVVKERTTAGDEEITFQRNEMGEITGLKRKKLKGDD